MSLLQTRAALLRKSPLPANAVNAVDPLAATLSGTPRKPVPRLLQAFSVNSGELQKAMRPYLQKTLQIGPSLATLWAP